MSDEHLVPAQAGVRDDRLAEGELIKLGISGDEAALEALARIHSGRIFRLAYHLLGDYEAALDVLQDSFVRLFRSLRTVDPKRGASAWLHRVAVNLIRDRLRKRKRRGGEAILQEQTQGSSEEPWEAAERKDLRAAVHDVLMKLPERYRVALVMREMEGMSPREIARLIGCKEATTRWRIYRARRLFEDIWRREGHLDRWNAGD